MVVQKFHLNILVFYNIGFLFENREGRNRICAWNLNFIDIFLLFIDFFVT